MELSEILEALDTLIKKYDDEDDSDALRYLVDELETRCNNADDAAESIDDSEEG